MIVAYVIGGVLVWAAIAFGLAAFCRGVENRGDAQNIAWITALWPITVPLITVFATIFFTIAGGVWVGDRCVKGIAKASSRYIDFIHGER